MPNKIKVFKDFTYYALIKEAIYSTKNMQATASEIFNYFVLRFPSLFMSYNSMTWKGNIRQVLSKNPEFIKMQKVGCKKEHFWSHRPIEIIHEEETKALAIEGAKKLFKKKEISIEKYPNYLKQKKSYECNFNEKTKENQINTIFEIQSKNSTHFDTKGNEDFFLELQKNKFKKK